MMRFLTVACLLILSATTAQAAQRYEDLLGKWCQATLDTSISYTFTMTELTVRFGSGEVRVLRVKDYRAMADYIHVNWQPPYTDTAFEVNDGGATLIQRVTTEGPRRIFKRCDGRSIDTDQFDRPQSDRKFD